MNETQRNYSYRFLPHVDDFIMSLQETGGSDTFPVFRPPDIVVSGLGFTVILLLSFFRQWPSELPERSTNYHASLLWVTWWL